MTAAVPVFVRVNVCDALEPEGTLPKLKFVAFAAIVPEGVPLGPVFDAGPPALVNPTQPEIVIVASSIARTVNKASGLCRLESPVLTVR
jgi:hypothetical protein